MLGLDISGMTSQPWRKEEIHASLQFYFLIVGVLVVAGQASVALCEPCTLYKPRDVENARANVKQHAWARKIVRPERRMAAEEFSS